jgi:hypothetical protein
MNDDCCIPFGLIRRFTKTMTKFDLVKIAQKLHIETQGLTKSEIVELLTKHPQITKSKILVFLKNKKIKKY